MFAEMLQYSKICNKGHMQRISFKKCRILDIKIYKSVLQTLRYTQGIYTYWEEF